ncbi:family 20 glycosylhydrolase [Phytoactinopolyspora alkaliphila]|uniref:beta-N-acetylhexosaminidase n=1 Tax=Phytoactinopolyspora alkaliphila TaxID=1783498 RepID=A0A6N9YIN8_9ACTN|nr:glycoside hydrolase family 20 zincin-like fold domain-containing protein [Phytoactinopolyspora alkaliphila]NED94768.1 family 20 glycosylhydrolase [Phytoactinopolyspora alkaliphila]
MSTSSVTDAPGAAFGGSRPPALIPQPREARFSADRLPVGRIALDPLPASLAAYQSHIERLMATVGDHSESAVRMSVTAMNGPPEAYELEIGADAVLIRASDAHGALHAARTVVDLWDGGNGRHLPHGRVDDHPTYRTRGVFTESFAGTDLMERADWQAFIDRLGQLKLNTAGISIYGCWDIRHDVDRSEYLFVPLDEFPEVRTPQRVVTWDPDSGEEVTLEYLPRIFTENFFGELVRYAAEQGIELIPHLGGPGHSTLLPRLIPELSAWDDDGNPTGYGYCVSRPEARAALSAVVSNITRQHLRPHGVRRLHVAADEYYPIRNVDPEDRLRVVSPYCRCDGCRDMSPGQQLIEYLVTVGRSLAEDGITMVHWHDTLEREGVLNRYRERVAEEDLPAPVVSWWKYNDPVPVPDASGGETWVSPTTGLFATLFNQDFSPNIETTLRRGGRAGATGAFAYTMQTPSDHANYACFADLAWNLEGSGGATGFRRRWAELICPDDADAATHALSLASTVTGSYPLMMYLVQHILPYFSTAAAGVTAYPDDIIRAASITQPPLEDAYRQVKATLLDAAGIMPEGRNVRHWGSPTETWRRQSIRLAGSLALFLDVLEAAREPGEDHAGRLTDRGVQLMRQTADATPAYLVPATIREHWGFVREIGPALERLRATGGPVAKESWHAWIV